MKKIKISPSILSADFSQLGNEIRKLENGGADMIHVRTGGAELWGITQLTFGIVGASVSLVSMVVVSLLTKAPDRATQDMIDELRIPSGKTILGKQH